MLLKSSIKISHTPIELSVYKISHFLMKYPQLLMSGLIFAISGYECFIKNKNTIRTF